MPFLYVDDGIMEILIAWLKSHEGDIADGINDFGELKPVYETLFMEDAQPDGKHEKH